MNLFADALEKIGFVVPGRSEAAQTKKVLGYETLRKPATIRLETRRGVPLMGTLRWLPEPPWIDVELLRCVTGMWVWAALLYRLFFGPVQYVLPVYVACTFGRADVAVCEARDPCDFASCTFVGGGCWSTCCPSHPVIGCGGGELARPWRLWGGGHDGLQGAVGAHHIVGIAAGVHCVEAGLLDQAPYQPGQGTQEPDPSVESTTDIIQRRWNSMGRNMLREMVMEGPYHSGQGESFVGGLRAAGVETRCQKISGGVPCGQRALERGFCEGPVHISPVEFPSTSQGGVVMRFENRDDIAMGRVGSHAG